MNHSGEANMATATRTPVAAFHSALVAFLRNGTSCNFWNSDHPTNALNGRLYTQQEWQDRGEPYSNDAIGGTLVQEGDFCQAMNYGWPDGKWDFHTKFTEFVASHGYFCEMGYHWSFHFYEA